MTTYRVIYMLNFARSLKVIDAKNKIDLIQKLDSRCIQESQIVSIKEGY
jgi:hypothetical protein